MFKIINKSTTTLPQNSKGFTLAETLITLVIIGIVAAITVPTLITKYQKEQTVTRLKKAYSALSQTTARAVADNGPINTWEVENTKSKEFAEKYFLPYLSVGKICGYDTTGMCNLKYATLNNRKNFKNFKEYYSNPYAFYLQDGTAIIANATAFKRSEQEVAYVVLFVDINGIKKPNVLGKDVFEYVYYTKIESEPENPIIGKFRGQCQGLKTREEMFKDYLADGRCGQTRIMMDGWQIKDDYPW